MNAYKNNPLRAVRCGALLLGIVFITAFAQAQTPSSAKANRSDAISDPGSKAEFRLLDFLGQRRPRRAGFSLIPSSGQPRIGVTSEPSLAAASSPAVHGTGTVGKLSLWVDSSPSGSSLLGDSIITQLNDQIGIGTTAPTSKLTVAGMIETTLGGVKFPDGTVQTTAAVSGLQSIIHDATLRGEGTSSSPLGVAIPLALAGPTGSTLFFGGDEGLVVKSGDISFAGFAATGVQAIGGKANAGEGGDGVTAIGGDGLDGGEGVTATGGNSSGAIGGDGVMARGGDSTVFGFGGIGVRTVGGLGIGAGHKGGLGLFAQGGLGEEGATTGDAGHFAGNVEVSGNLSKGGGSFKIDHPLDPENKYLYHSFVESPDMKNIYDGNVITDQNGEATVTLPDYFEALNRDFRYQLTVIGTFAEAIIADEIKDNRFRIKSSAAGVKVSWQVTGIRRDAYANKHRIKVEENKPEQERGFYLHPEAFNQPEERRVEWARHPEMMRQMKEAHAKQTEELKQKPPTRNR